MTLIFPKIVWTCPLTQRQFHLETHCLFLHLRICLHCQKIVYTQSSFVQGKINDRPSYADTVTATSWSPRSKEWVRDHYRPGRRLYYPEADIIHKTRALGGSGFLPSLLTLLEALDIQRTALGCYGNECA